MHDTASYQCPTKSSLPPTPLPIWEFCTMCVVKGHQPCLLYVPPRVSLAHYMYSATYEKYSRAEVVLNLLYIYDPDNHSLFIRVLDKLVANMHQICVILHCFLNSLIIPTTTTNYYSWMMSWILPPHPLITCTRGKAIGFVCCLSSAWKSPDLYF